MNFQQDPELGSSTSRSDPDLTPHTNTDSPTRTGFKFKPGSTVLLYSILTFTCFCLGLRHFLALVPSKMGYLSILRLPFFCFSVGLWDLFGTLALLFLLTTFFERKLGSLGIFIRLGIHKLELAIMAKGFYEFLMFIGMDRAWDQRLTLAGFWPLFVVIFAEFAFDRHSESIKSRFTNIEIKYVGHFCFRLILFQDVYIWVFHYQNQDATHTYQKSTILNICKICYNTYLHIYKSQTSVSLNSGS